MAPSREVYGDVAPGYERVKEAFRKNFNLGREQNAQLCVYVEGQKVVDLWGSANDNQNYNANTLQTIFSSTKSLTAIVVAKLVDQGLLDYGEKIGCLLARICQKWKGKYQTRRCVEA